MDLPAGAENAVATKSIADFVKEHGGQRVVSKILIANNGMAATKAIISMRKWAFMELGSYKELEFIAMASADDLKANAEFIRLADAYVEVPAGKNVNNYANVDLICQIAKQRAVHAVWPGWGHASENPKLPAALKAMGITFLGPSAPVMHALGDKIASTILAQSSKVPCIPWNGDGITADIQEDGSIPKEPFEKACLKSFEEAKACAARIGYPVVLKASEGGGGKGIRKATNDEELKLGWEQVTTEVVGSPIFMMQLCVGARHLEVQLVGDEYGDVIALCGRDCSTQRRFQKIFEEGPPIVAPKDGFREAEKAAQRLAMSVKYCGAGTVEYLFKPDSNGFYFLELNPRLQVEHPVTEGITGVNLPALQLQIGMGIPLSRVPDVRRFYGLEDAHGTSKIDFLNDTYLYPTSHVIAARVTAENPDDAFRPTSGKIDRVRFQSAPSAWGYFSIGVNGAIHEFADSQFGHIFAKGKTREEARKTLQLTLKQLSVTGEIRTPVEYLVELSDTKEFRENTIDTAWLDKLIAAKSVKTNFRTLDAVFYAACFRAYTKVKESTEALIAGLDRGHLPLSNDLRLIQSFTVDVAYDSTKYVFQVVRTNADAFAFTIEGSTVEARIREQPDGSLYIASGTRISKVSGVEEPLGLRLRIEGGATVVFPRIRDPSELRSDFNGKLVRYIHADGADVTEGEPFAELEAMKMIMSLRATASGKIHHSLGAGAVVGAGELLATLDLKDPSRVQMVKTFSGPFELSDAEASPSKALPHDGSVILDMTSNDVQQLVSPCLSGYFLSPAQGYTTTKLVQTLFRHDEQNIDEEKAMSTCHELLSIFLRNEKYFAGLVGGNETQIKAKFSGESRELLALLVAHHSLNESLQIVCTLLRGLASYVSEFVMEHAPLPAKLRTLLEELAALPPAGGYGEVCLLSNTVLDSVRKAPFNERREEVKTLLMNTARKDLESLAKHDVFEGKSYFGLDLISDFFKDEDSSIRTKAVELYLRRLHRGYTLHDVETIESKDVVDSTPAGCYHASFKSTPSGATGVSSGYLALLPDFSVLSKLKSSWSMPAASGPLAEAHVLVARAPRPELKDPKMQQEARKKLMSETDEVMAAVGPKLEAKGYLRAFVLLVQEEAHPISLHYTKASGWKEIEEFRGMRATMPQLLELTTLRNEATLAKLLNTRRTCVFAATSKNSATESLNVRAVSYLRVGLDNFGAALEQMVLESFDMIERVLLAPDVEQKKLASRIFVHVIRPIPGCTDRDLRYIRGLFDKMVLQLTVNKNADFLRLRVEKVQVKVWAGEDSCIPLLLEASSTNGWSPLGFRETIDKDTGLPISWEDVETTEKRMVAATAPMEQKFMQKRKTARKEGSTYIYDFLSLFRLNVAQCWFASGSDVTVPNDCFTAQELVMDASGELQPSDRLAGENDVGMVAWLCTMKTPEYPSGREILLIGNDLTIKAGSFGVVEDTVFYKASKLARDKGIPRIYIACNSGARLGCVEELKKLVQVAWTDPKDPNKGFDYLYLTAEDLAKLPEGSVKAHEVLVGGQKRMALDAIMGLNLPSVKGGIGVENLQGSGLIAGETSRAYEETFTLSYITGRSVGIGAYLNRLGQRNIQMVKGPMILTGYQALNKLLGQQVYTTQDQLGGPHIMVPNGVTHELVRNDQDGVEAILKWLAYVPCDVHSVPPYISPVDKVDRQVAFMPTKAPYDPRHMLAGVTVDGEFQAGFCDEGSFHEYMEGWGKTVVVGRGRLGGLPVGIVAVETRSVVRHIPADPADLASHDIQEAQAGQVWFPDSAFKTAQAIRDFNRGENLPLIIFANWRGFSGGTRDMFAEVLKYGAMIVDALVEYKHPVTIYIPPNGELRGGAWVVLDPKINPDQMEMFADKESRGGILEPPAAAEIVFKRDDHVLQMMHRVDPELQRLDAEAKSKDVSKEIKAREKLLLPVFRQVSVTYCDLHDRSDRMKGLGAIHEQLEWRSSRAYLHWRIRRRLLEGSIAKRLQAAVSDLSTAEAKDSVRGLLESSLKAPAMEDDRAVVEWLLGREAEVDAFVETERQTATAAKIFELVSTLPAEKQAEVVRDLVGYSKVQARTSVRK
eukprot:TRINITY_DN15382_c0_g1_i1.p1 TRINITY_DN15382_c0_g1~~TRINITY_DN15382_c0_g1_i1.p1  ORF type:complete len:2081 (+),score=604.78 TRINITY_DN15382_c0_g1_i1:101-6343(+)